MRFNKHLNIARLIFIQLFIMISFAIFYYYIGTSTQDQHFRIVEGKITPLKALYLSIVTQTTVGFGDIAPISAFSDSMLYGRRRNEVGANCSTFSLTSTIPSNSVNGGGVVGIINTKYNQNDVYGIWIYQSNGDERCVNPKVLWISGIECGNYA